MDDNNQQEKKTFRFIWSLLMVFIYIAIAYLLVLTTIFEGSINRDVRIGMAILLVVYGLFRGYRLWRLGK